ncbi:hypothetical protein R2R32_00480 [Clostridium perfringens]|nr:hypothetical protein [Clostridium perfringens]
MDIIKQEYEDYWNVSEVEREICREKLRQQLPMLRGVCRCVASRYCKCYWYFKANL